MPRAEAVASSGLPLFECSSFDLAPSMTCLWKRELNNFLVFHLFTAVSLFVNIQHIFLLHADWPKLTALSMALATGGTETEFNSWDVTASSPSFFALLPERPGKACLQLNMFFFNPVRVKWKQVIFFNTTCIYSMTLQRVFVEFSSSWWGPENWQNDGSICQEILRSKPWSVYVIWYAKKYYHMI